MIARLNPLGTGCRCVAQHAPASYVGALHHILPQSWGGKTVQENLVMLCPNAHTSVHRLLDEHVRHGGTPPWSVRVRFSAYITGLAVQAWAQRPENPRITSLPPHQVYSDLETHL